MASSWGNSWGTAGAHSWGAGAPVPPAVITVDQASNWQANYWKRRSKKELDEQIRQQRIALGIVEDDVEIAKLLHEQERRTEAEAVQAIQSALDAARLAESRAEYADGLWLMEYHQSMLRALLIEYGYMSLKLNRRKRAIALLLN